jgi:hypothetical protein
MQQLKVSYTDIRKEVTEKKTQNNFGEAVSRIGLA